MASLQRSFESLVPDMNESVEAELLNRRKSSGYAPFRARSLRQDVWLVFEFRELC